MDPPRLGIPRLRLARVVVAVVARLLEVDGVRDLDLVSHARVRLVRLRGRAEPRVAVADALRARQAGEDTSRAGVSRSAAEARAAGPGMRRHSPKF